MGIPVSDTFLSERRHVRLTARVLSLIVVLWLLAALLQAASKVLKQENKLLKAWDDLKTTINRLRSKKRANKKPRKKH
jgi:hypothetical protein